MARKKISETRKRIVAERANECCEYCQSQARFATQSFSIEHILPVSKSGENSLDNLALSCQGCNNFKYNKTEAKDPISGESVLLFNPRRQIWREHFVWNDNFSIILGTSKVGRATIYALNLNRGSLINLRRVLYEAGEHPLKV